MIWSERLHGHRSWLTASLEMHKCSPQRAANFCPCVCTHVRKEDMALLSLSVSCTVSGAQMRQPWLLDEFGRHGNVGMVSSSDHRLLSPMLGSRPAAAFLVMKHHIEEISPMSLQEVAPSVLLTCLSFRPRRSRLPRATCNDILASVLTRLSPAPQLGQPCTRVTLCPLHLPS